MHAEGPVYIHALACDYDGTIAVEGRVAGETARALARVRASGRRLVLVTGRLLPDLRSVCPHADRMFDAIVAENGAVVYLPPRREARSLGPAPELALVEGLKARAVPFAIGRSIIATTAAWAQTSLAVIRETGIDRTLVFNKGSLMLLPGGITKGTGLDAALGALGLSSHNVVAVGDAENDHALLGLAECGVAVADAVPALRERADLVTRAPNARGVIELVEEHVLGDCAEVLPRIARHRLSLGEDAAGVAITIDAHSTRLLVVGPSATGQSTLTAVLVERIVDSGRTVLVLDPEGDHQTLADLPHVVVLGGKAARALPTGDEVDQLLRHRRSSVVLNLSAMTRAEKVDYAATVLSAVTAVRSRTGLPHWLVIDEAHHVLPPEGSPATALLRGLAGAVGIITLMVTELAPEVPSLANAVASTDLQALQTAVRAALEDRRAAFPRIDGPPLPRGEAALVELGATPWLSRFRVATQTVQLRRHARKYTEGELPAERSFFFRGPEGSLNLRAANLVRFVEIAEGIDAATWAYHLGRGDYSAWLRREIKDAELADEVAALERAGGPPAASRRRVLDAVRHRYAV